MKIKLPKNYYRWQPELPISIIFWSLTFGIFFFSIIYALESNGVNLESVLIFIVFLIVVWIGLQRYFIIEGQQILFRTLLKRKRNVFQIQDIKKVSVGKLGLTLYIEEDRQREVPVMMTKKTKQSFISGLKEIHLFNGKIEEVEKSIG